MGEKGKWLNPPELDEDTTVVHKSQSQSCIYIVKSGNSGLLVIPDVQCKSIEKFQIVRTYQQSMPSQKRCLFAYSSY